MKELLTTLGHTAKECAQTLAQASNIQKNKALLAIAVTLNTQAKSILTANQKDITIAQEKGRNNAFIDRLRLSEKSITAMTNAIDEVVKLDDPVGKTLAHWQRPNGLKIEKISVPLGVIGIIFESRPNVTADAACLCLKSGNAAILRAGSESFHSASVIMNCIQQGLIQADLPKGCVQLIPTQDRQAVTEMLHLDKFIDVIIPRGGKSLIQHVSQESRIPVFKHLDGICHTYIHKEADIDMANEIVFNAKMRRPGICGATETLLIDTCIVNSHLPKIIDQLIAAQCEVRGDALVTSLDKRIKPAISEDWDSEYLDNIISIKTVNDIDEAIAHIQQHGSQHTDAIISNDNNAAEKFFRYIDSAIVMHNTSTQFADGGEFGLGAEIGIATGKLHARGPVGIEQLTTYKYIVRGGGQVRAL
ncbi:MAG: glutamate-5-semialdehyde dehydrogenase [Gammaproteobacteria bacterium]